VFRSDETRPRRTKQLATEGEQYSIELVRCDNVATHFASRVSRLVQQIRLDGAVLGLNSFKDTSPCLLARNPSYELFLVATKWYGLVPMLWVGSCENFLAFQTVTVPLSALNIQSPLRNI